MGNPFFKASRDRALFILYVFTRCELRSVCLMLSQYTCFCSCNWRIQDVGYKTEPSTHQTGSVNYFYGNIPFSFMNQPGRSILNKANGTVCANVDQTFKHLNAMDHDLKDVQDNPQNNPTL